MSTRTFLLFGAFSLTEPTSLDLWCLPGLGLGYIGPGKLPSLFIDQAGIKLSVSLDNCAADLFQKQFAQAKAPFIRAVFGTLMSGVTATCFPTLSCPIVIVTVGADIPLESGWAWCRQAVEVTGNPIFDLHQIAQDQERAVKEFRRLAAAYFSSGVFEFQAEGQPATAGQAATEGGDGDPVKLAKAA